MECKYLGRALVLAVASFVLLVGAGVASAVPVAHWALDENPSGLVMIDSTGNGHDAAVGGSPLSIGAVAGQGLNLSGATAEYLTAADSTGLHLPSFTLSAWARYDSILGEVLILGKHVPGTENGFFLSVRNNQFTLFLSYDATRLVTPNTYNDSLWHHVVGTYDAATSGAEIYVDGLPAFSTTTGRASNNETSLLIGGTGSGYPAFAGSLDDVQVYDHALTGSQVTFLHSHPGQMIPEPATLSLLALGGLAMIRRRRK